MNLKLKDKLNLSKLVPLTVRNRMKNVIHGILFFVSLCVMVAIIIDYGFNLQVHEQYIIDMIYHYAWWIYFISFNIQILFDIRQIPRKKIVMTLLMGLLLYLSALPQFFTLSQGWQWLAGVWSVLGHHFFKIMVLAFFSLTGISRGVTTIINKHTNPALLMAGSFAFIILLGTVLLLEPRSTLPHIQLPVIDALFVSTSAVCVTGLSTVDIAQTFTLKGQIIIAMLIQIGGLGVMTITSFFALFFMGGTGVYNQFALRDMFGSDTFNSLISTLLYILFFTFAIEGMGAIAIWLSIHNTLGITFEEEVFFSIFHAISAFCNAGFSTLTGNLGNEAVMTGHNNFYLIISALIVLGGIGFPILVNFRNIITYHIGRFIGRIFNLKNRRERYVHLTNVNTRIVLNTTLLLIIAGSVAIAVLEWNNAFATMPVVDKITHSIFNAIAPRTAGFNSVDLTHFSMLSIIVYTILMWIGGSSQSTAGGIKVNTFAIAMANMVSVIKGRNAVILYNREISVNSIRRAAATIFGSIITILTFFIALTILEPQLSAKGLLFEVISAFSTVGSSLNITAQLSEVSKGLVTLLMFIGRVGLITFMMSFVSQQHSNPKFKHPKDDVIIN